MISEHAPAGRRRFLAASAASLSMMAAARPGRTPLHLGLVTYQWGRAMPLAELPIPPALARAPKELQTLLLPQLPENYS